jgi:hypothetical protein
LCIPPGDIRVIPDDRADTVNYVVASQCKELGPVRLPSFVDVVVASSEWDSCGKKNYRSVSGKRLDKHMLVFTRKMLSYFDRYREIESAVKVYRMRKIPTPKPFLINH